MGIGDAQWTNGTVLPVDGSNVLILERHWPERHSRTLRQDISNDTPIHSFVLQELLSERF
jgi:hypothetical protein